jgi:hypothetical protein
MLLLLLLLLLLLRDEISPSNPAEEARLGTGKFATRQRSKGSYSH